MAIELGDGLEKFARIPLKQRVAVLFLVVALLGAAFYFLLYSDQDTESSRQDGRIRQLREEKSSYEAKKQQYMAFRAEVNKLLEEQKELVKVLPTDAEIPTFLQSIHAQGELSGLNIVLFEQLPEVPQNFYAQIPVKMSLLGSFHQVNKFFYSVGQLKRIVNIKDLSLTLGEPGSQGMMLKADFTASTFRFLPPQQQQGVPQPAGAPHG